MNATKKSEVKWLHLEKKQSEYRNRNRKEVKVQREVEIRAAAVPVQAVQEEVEIRAAAVPVLPALPVRVTAKAAAKEAAKAAAKAVTAAPLKTIKIVVCGCVFLFIFSSPNPFICSFRSCWVKPARCRG